MKGSYFERGERGNLLPEGRFLLRSPFCFPIFMIDEETLEMAEGSLETLSR